MTQEALYWSLAYHNMRDTWQANSETGLNERPLFVYLSLE